MRPKGKLLALVVMFAAVGLITATGAFTTVEAERTADVETAGDGSALVGIAVNSSSDFTNTGGDTVAIELSTSNPSNNGEGVNLDAITSENSTLDITNNGQDPVEISVSPTVTNGDVAFYVNESYSGSVGDTSSNVSADGTLASSSIAKTTSYYMIGSSTSGSTTSVTVQPGHTVVVGIYIDTIGITSTPNPVFDGDTITIEATAV